MNSTQNARSFATADGRLPSGRGDCWPWSRRGRSPLLSGQLGNDRRECVGGVSTDDEIGKADLRAAPLDFIGGRGGVARKDDQRIGRAKLPGVEVGRRHERSDTVTD